MRSSTGCTPNLCLPEAALKHPATDLPKTLIGSIPSRSHPGNVATNRPAAALPVNEYLKPESDIGKTPNFGDEPRFRAPTFCGTKRP